MRSSTHDLHRHAASWRGYAELRIAAAMPSPALCGVAGSRFRVPHVMAFTACFRTPHNSDSSPTQFPFGEFVMFDRCFCPRVARRLRASPDADWLGSFLAALHRCGYARLTVQFYLREAELFGRWLRRHHRSLTTLTDADVRRFATRPPLRRLRCNARSAGHHLLRHLRDRGLVPPRPAPAPARIERVVAAYDTHLRDAAGLARQARTFSGRCVDMPEFSLGENSQTTGRRKASIHRTGSAPVKPARSREWKSRTGKAQPATPTPSHAWTAARPSAKR
ncbi:hypothetical protein ETAA1_39040 [Urbifossiella limnaea]|uniref:Uncharacterized protein n=1 Tax=Urbifossiella limnaea TaxID=2528023 RepID=A0A517XWP6_9BACT|nr:hypothetical protein ETAA1_39040 [Urbifossiella limnaea]